MVIVDAVTPSRQPNAATWSPRALLGYTGTGAPVYSGKREITLTFARLTFAEYEEWEAFFDGEPHDIEVTDPDGDQAEYEDCYLEHAGGDLRAGAWYGPTIRIFNIYAP